MPKSVMPEDIDSTVRIMREFLRNPIDLEGKSAKDLLQKKRKKAIMRKKRSAPRVENSGDEAVTAGRPTKRRKTKRAAELQQFKSAAYIDDSDDAAEADEAFYERELELQRINRQKMLTMGHIAPDNDGTEVSRPKKTSTQRMLETQQNSSDDEQPSQRNTTARSAADSDNEIASPSSPESTRTRTLGNRPVPRRKVRAASFESSPTRSRVDEEEAGPSNTEDVSDREGSPRNGFSKTNGKKRIIAESDEDD